MTKKLLAREDVAFDVDRSRMIKVLQKSRLADKTAYIRDLLVPAVETRATKVSVHGSVRRIVITDNGQGIPYQTLDEKLANIFTEDETDHLATGILSSFQAGIQTVHLETVPAQAGEEPYRISIFHREGDIHVSDPEPLENKLAKGTRITLVKEGVEDINSVRSLGKALLQVVKNSNVPELAHVRTMYPRSGLELSVNRRVMPQKWKKPGEFLVQAPISYRNITGTLQLIKDAGMHYFPKSRNNEFMTLQHSKIIAFRKGFFHGEYSYEKHQALSLPCGPFVAELNDDSLKVDISGKKLTGLGRNETQILNWQEAIKSAVPALYEELLKRPDSIERTAQLQLYSTIYFKQLLHVWEKEQDKKGRSYYQISSTETAPAGFVEIHRKVLQEKIYTTKDSNKVSLDDLFENVGRTRHIFLDYRGYDYRKVFTETLAIRIAQTRDLSPLVIKKMQGLRVTVEELHDQTNGHWKYKNFESDEALEKKRRREGLEKILKIPLLYRPMQLSAFAWDIIKNSYQYRSTYAEINPSSSTQQTPQTPQNSSDDLDLLVGSLVTIFGVPTYSVALAATIAYSAFETGAKGICFAANKAAPYVDRGLEYALTAFSNWQDKRTNRRLVLEEMKARRYLPSESQCRSLDAMFASESTADENFQGMLARRPEKQLTLLQKALATTTTTAGFYARALANGSITGARYIGNGAKTGAIACGKGIAIAAGATLAGIGIAGALAYHGGKLAYHGGKVVVQGIGRGIATSSSYINTNALTPLSTRYAQWREQRAEKRAEHKFLTTSLREALEESMEENERERRKYSPETALHQTLTALGKKESFTKYNFSLMKTSEMKKKTHERDYLARTIVYHQHGPFGDYYNAQIIFLIDEPQIKKISAALNDIGESEKAQAYLGSCIIDEASLTKNRHRHNEMYPSLESIAECMRDFHLTVLDQLMEQKYQSLIRSYSQQNAQEFMEKYATLDRQAKEETVYRILALPRVPSIDTLFESDPANSELLEQAGRRRLEEGQERNEKSTYASSAVESSVAE